MLIERARLRKYFDHADGTGNPLMWFAFTDNAWGDADGPMELVAGPCKTRRELEAQIEIGKVSA